MNSTEKLLFAFSACVFAAISISAVIVYGGHAARSFAIASSFIACLSQFVAQDTSNRAYRISIGFAYTAFATFVAAFILMVLGR